jgi:MFS transporter, DHA3 family, macrolide efflux protein
VTPFRHLWLAQTVSVVGDFLALFAVQVAIVFRMHGSARDVASVFVASLAPSVVLGPLAGVFADRWDPRWTMVVSDLARGILILLLTQAATVPQIRAITFAVGCCSIFFSPAQTITVPLLVPRTDLLAANARLQQSMQVVRMASPALASALVAAFGERTCYAADSASFFVSAALLTALRYSRPPPAKSARNVFCELGSGFHFLLTDSRFSFVTLALTAGTFAAGCFGALASLYVRDILHRGPGVLSMIASLIAAGTLAGSLVLKGCGRDPRRLIGGGMAAVGASILLIALVPETAAALVGSAAMGLGVAVVVIAANVMLQGETPPGLRGRASGAAASLTSLSQLAAILLSGWWAARVGIRGVFLVSAALLFATGVSGCKRCRLRQVRLD